MHSGIPYFSNFSNQKKSSIATAPVYSSIKTCYSPAALGLGLPTTLRPTLKRTNFLDQIFPQTQQKPQGLLAAAETSAVIDRQFEEINKAKFFDLASTETVKNFSKLAQSSSNRFNPLKSQTQLPKAKKRKLDIFD